MTRTSQHAASRSVAVLLAATLVVALSVLSVSAAPATNDDIANATVVPSIPFRERIQLADATPEASDPLCAQRPLDQARSVWYSFTPARSTSFDVEMPAPPNGGDDAVLAAYRGDPSSLEEIGCTFANANIFNVARVRIADADAGETLYIMLAHAGNARDTSTKITIRPERVPANDRIEDATVIDELPFHDRVDTFWANNEGDPPNAEGCPILAHSVWYQFTAPRSMRVEFTGLGYGAHTRSAAYIGSLGSLTQVDCSAGDFGRSVFASLEAGDTAYFAAECCPQGGDTSASLNRVPLEKAANDSIDTARAVGRRFSDTLKITQASAQLTDPDCFGAGATVWFRFVAPFTMRAQVTTAGSAYDTVLSVSERAPRGPEQFACQNDNIADDPVAGFGFPAEAIRFRATEGRVYLVMVGGLEDPSILNLSLGEYVPVTLEDEASKVADGGVELRGTIRCSHPLSGHSQTIVTQTLDSGRVLTGVEFIARSCTEGLRRFALDVFPSSGRFRSGTVQVEMPWGFVERGPGRLYATTEISKDVAVDRR